MVRDIEAAKLDGSALKKKQFPLGLNSSGSAPCLQHSMGDATDISMKCPSWRRPPEHPYVIHRRQVFFSPRLRNTPL